VWIDDYEPALALYKLMFESLGYRVLTASRGSAGLELARLPQVDAVVTDYEMPEMNGDEVVTTLKKMRPSLPVVLFTGSSHVPERLMNQVDGYCDKADSRDILIGAIRAALQPQTLSRSATPVYAA
jgi:CheY-like chemotaxis protein